MRPIEKRRSVRLKKLKTLGMELFTVLDAKRKITFSRTYSSTNVLGTIITHVHGEGEGEREGRMRGGEGGGGQTGRGD